ncbi:7TM diverse intracellular signaling domain-containing protein [Aromatoleum evansii]|uniref:7TM diverse intracellular signaling domain-containing protein n=1 Tax=Aromatoleum evansii TaxID=59406 RepID=UPI00145DC15A
MRLGVAAGSVPLAGHLDFVEDERGILDVADLADPAVAARFRPAGFKGNDINFGYSASAFWLRLDVEPEAGRPADWLLEIGFPSLDRVDVFVAGPNGMSRQTGGDLRPFSARPFAHRNLVFPLALESGVVQTVYLRVESKGSLTVPATLWTPAALHRHDHAQYAILALYYGMLFALGAYNLLLYLSLHDRVYLAYVAFVAAMAVGQLSLNGLGNQFLWPNWPAWGDVALPSGFAAAGLFGALFTRIFLETRRQTSRLDRLIVVLAAGFAIAVLVVMPVNYRVAAVLISLLGLAFSLTAVVAGVRCLLNRYPGARYFLVAWSLLLGGVAVMGMRNLSWLPTNLFTTYAMQLGSALEMLLLSFALADRIHIVRRGKEAAQLEMLAVKETMVETLQRSERELEQRVAQRTAELAAANERLRENEVALIRAARHDHLTGLANRVLLEDRIEHAIGRWHRQGSVFSLLVIDLDGFKAINDGFGHAAGDELLKVLADRLSNCVRATDTVSRLGGDEFVVLLEAMNDPAQALRIGNKIVAALSRPVPLGETVVHVGASVGIALFPCDGEDANALMLAADHAMYGAKQGGRGRCVLANAPGGPGSGNGVPADREPVSVPRL